MITDLIVGSSIVFGIAFLAVWLASPSLRAWIERPKYRFQKNVQTYDKARVSNVADPGKRRSL
jgi:hypothetical protein